MKLTAQMTAVFAAIFATICFGFAITGFIALKSITDPVQAADSKGYALFWAFLGTVVLLFGVWATWIVRTEKNKEES
ncbi:MAG: hypothetical protein EPN25_05755 [Nitrospirae bacterium]|nr:MAG: hypothetical protein EPN25_05755 [Nitrospirota bacterium]